MYYTSNPMINRILFTGIVTVKMTSWMHCIVIQPSSQISGLSYLHIPIQYVITTLLRSWKFLLMRTTGTHHNSTNALYFQFMHCPRLKLPFRVQTLCIGQCLPSPLQLLMWPAEYCIGLRSTGVCKSRCGTSHWGHQLPTSPKLRAGDDLVLTLC